MTGKGSANEPGRWNRPGKALIYTSTHRSLAVSETSAHLDDSELPLNRFLVEISVPVQAWARRKIIRPTILPPGRQAIPAGASSVDRGSSWHAALASALLVVPSVIVEEEFNVLINPQHPDAAGITGCVIRPFEYNKLFRAR